MFQWWKNGEVKSNNRIENSLGIKMRFAINNQFLLNYANTEHNHNSHTHTHINTHILQCSYVYLTTCIGGKFQKIFNKNYYLI